jgi:GT2 family glycosyltransferase
MKDNVVKISNEEIKVPKILICVLCHYERSGWIQPGLMDFLVGLRFNMDYATVVAKAFNFIPAAGARNFFGEQVKNADPQPDWILMLDNDMEPSGNLLDTIKDAPKDAMVVVPKFHLWDADRLTTKLCWGLDDSKLERFPDGRSGFKIEKKYYELTKCGTGAIFIKPEVFHKIEAPWFEYKYDKLGNMAGTEDITFCEKVIAAGMKIYGYGGIQVKHHHTVELSLINRILYEEKSEISDKKQIGAD